MVLLPLMRLSAGKVFTFEKKIFLIFFVGSALLHNSGCARIPFTGRSPQKSQDRKAISKNIVATERSAQFVLHGKVIDQTVLIKSKNIAVIPFTAGAGVAATEELEKTALMIIKGLADAVTDDRAGSQSRYKILTSENADQADLIVRGHITAMQGPSKIKRWVLMNNRKTLTVGGKVEDAGSGTTVLVFDDRVGTLDSREEYQQLGYRIGQNIGRYILSQSD